MGDIGGMAGAAANMFGSTLGFIGQRQTNEQNQENFWSAQQFNANQAALNRTFQDTEQTKAEDWMTMLSDTAMQRRVADLKTAGLNPLLAIGQGGASTPGIGAPGGSTAASPGLPNIQNPMDNLQRGVQSATEAYLMQKQAAVADAQAKKIISETPSQTGTEVTTDDKGVTTVTSTDQTHALGDAQLKQIQALTGLAGSQAKQAQNMYKYIDTQITNMDANTALTNITAMGAAADATVKMGVAQYLIQQARQQTEQGETKTWLNTGTLGKVLGILGVAGPAISSALGGAAGAALGGGAKLFHNAPTPAPFGNPPIPQLSNMP